MKLKSKLTATIVSMCAAIAVMGVGVWASTSQSFRLTVQNDIDIKIDSVIADVWGEYAVYTEMMEEVTYNYTSYDPVTGAANEPVAKTDYVPGLLRWRTAKDKVESRDLDGDGPGVAQDMISAEADYTANNCYILYTQFGNGYNDGQDIVYNEDADWDEYTPDGSTYPNQGGNLGQNPSNGGVNNSGDHNGENGGTHAGGETVNDPNTTQPGNWKDVFVPGHYYDAGKNPLPYSDMTNSGLKNYLNFANFQYLDSGDTGSLPTDPHPNIPYPDTYYNIDYTTSYAQIVFMYTIRQYYVPGAENTIYLTVQDEVTDAFAQEITDTAGNSRVQRNYYLNYNGAGEAIKSGYAAAGYGQTATSGNGNDNNNTGTVAANKYADDVTVNTFFDNYGRDGAGSGDAVTAQWTALDAGVIALAGSAGGEADADTLRKEAQHYQLPNPSNNGVWDETKDHVWHLMCVYTFERTSTNVDLSGLADGVGHSLSLLTQEQLEQYYGVTADQLDSQTVSVGKTIDPNSNDLTAPAQLQVNTVGSANATTHGEAIFNVAMKQNANFAFAGRSVNGRTDTLGRSPVTIDNYDGCETADDGMASKNEKDQALSTAELATGFRSVFGLVTNPNARYAFRFSDMVREYGSGDPDWYDLYEPNRQLVGEFTDYQGSSADTKPILNINGITDNGEQVPVEDDRLGGYTPL